VALWHSPSASVLAIDPTQPQTLYAGGSYLAKSMDGGSSWRLAGDGFPEIGYSVRSLVLDPHYPSTLYVLIYTCDDTGACYERVFKSTDAALTWAACDAGLADEDTGIDSIAVAADGALYAGGMIYSRNAIFKSEDGGTTWRDSGNGVAGAWIQTLLADPLDPKTIYAGTTGGRAGVFRSDDAGASWAAINNGFPPELGVGWLEGIHCLKVDPGNPSRLYAATGGGVYSIVLGQMLPGDCDGDGEVSIGEMQRAINMFLGVEPANCGADCNGDWEISIGEVQRVINAFLGLENQCS
jgi:hypothetical protein